MMNNFHTQLQQLAAQNQHLQDVIADRRPTPAPTTDTPFSHTGKAHIKFNKPPEFDGRDKKAANAFLTHLRLHFLATPHLFPSDKSKILFAATYLRGPAFAWFEPHLLVDHDPLVQSWDAFQEAFLNSLGDPDRERTVTRELQTLVQTSSAAVYTTEFFRLSAFLKWNDEALQAQYYSGLKPEVKDALALSDKAFDTVQALSTFAIRLDNRLFERRKETRKASTSIPHNPPFAPSRTNYNPSGPAPMALDANRPRFQSLSPEERQLRIRNGLCLYCGQKNHIAMYCPNRRPRLGPRAPGPLQAAASTAVPSHELENSLAQVSEDATA
jgi:hypothetical protein